MKKYLKRYLKGQIPAEKIEKVRHLIIEGNAMSLRIYSTIAMSAWGFLFTLSWFSYYMQTFRWLYFFAFTCNAICFALSFHANRNKYIMFTGIGLLLCSHIIFGIMSGTVLNPDGPATTLVALIFVVPLLFNMVPAFNLLLIILTNACFIPLCIMYKSGDIMHSDILNVTMFSIVSFAVALLFSRTRIRQYILEAELKEAKELEEARSHALEEQCITDELTGMGNFYSYKSLCNQFSADAAGRKMVGVLFADLNRLKYINDNEGHEAGNEYIRSFAVRVLNAFGDYKCFRHSGDEFIVISLDGNREDFIVKANRFIEQIKSDKIPPASIGYDFDMTDKIEKNTTIAESRMYDDKLLFYARFPQFRR